MSPNVGLSHHEALEPLLAEHPQAVDFLTVRAEELLTPAHRHEATPALTDRFRVAVHGDFLALTASTPFDSLRARRLAGLADQCVFEWVAERLDAPSEPVAHLLDHVVERVEQLQDFLGAAVLVSNGARFHGPATPTTASLAFLSTLAQRTGCGLLLDLDTLCDEAPVASSPDGKVRAEKDTDAEPGNADPLMEDLMALDFDAVRGLAIRGLPPDRTVHASVAPLGDRPAALLDRLVAACRRLRGVTIDLGPERLLATDIDVLADGLGRMRTGLPDHSGVLAFPGTTTDRQGSAAPRPRGYLPGHGRGAPMRLVHCTPEADTPPAAGAGDTPPISGG